MTVADIEQIFEEWAPRWSAWERDNVGLQVGERTQYVSKILVALDVTDAVVEEAVAKKIDLIVSHHPLLFRPPTSITSTDEVGRLVLKLAQKGISLYSAHTNLDVTRGGVSFALAQALGLKNIRFLAPLRDTLCKLAVFVPHDHVDRLTEAMAQAGAGTIGEYTSCSFRLKGNGTFRSSVDAKPFVGKAGKLERVDETRLEMLVPKAVVSKVVTAMKAVHPYEEVAYDVYTLTNENPNFGMGAIGELSPPQLLQVFLKRVKKTLSASNVRFTGRIGQRVKTVVVCGGSGSDLLSLAIQAKAQVFVTADVRYHTFHSAVGRIALVDAGHWETEHVVLEPVARHLRSAAQKMKQKIKVYVTAHSTNPINTL